MSLEQALAKIKSPNLQSQQHTRIVLSSIEDTLNDQNTSFTPTAYFAALLSLLLQSKATPLGGSHTEIITSTVYLLDLFSPHVPAPLLRAQCSQLLSLLIPVLTNSEAAAPIVRSTIGCLESLLVAQDSSAWKLPQEQTGPRKAIPVILALALDGRPKVRKRSLEAVKTILQQPPPGPALDHPVADLCASTVLAGLKEALRNTGQAKGQKSHSTDGHDVHLIPLLQLTKAIAAASGGWPSKKIGPLVECLMTMSKPSNEYLVMSAFETFEVIFEGMQDEVSSSRLPSLLDAIVGLRPSQKDSRLLPPWMAVLSRGYQLASEVSSQDTFAKLPDLVDMLVTYLPQPSHNIRVSAAECLISLLANCIPHSVIIHPSIYDAKIFERLGQQANDLLSVQYQTAWMEVCKVLTALIGAMRWHSGQHLLLLIKAVGELRGNAAFQGKKEADVLFGQAIHHMGPETFLSILPLNLDQDSSKQQGRAWLLPLLRDNVSNTNLAHFKSHLMPLSERIYQQVIEHGDAEKTPRVKIFETVVHQIWATFPGYCDSPLDLQTAIDQSLAELVSNLLYKQSELRVDLCRGLQNLVESNQAVLGSDLSEEDLLYERRTTKSAAEKNLQHLATFAGNLLAVLFNVYSQTLPQSRGFILQCINAYLSVTSGQDIESTFERVSNVLQTSLPGPEDAPPSKQSQPKDKIPPTSHTLFDLVIALSTFLPRTNLSSLFSLASQVLNHPEISATDPQLIKKVYKLIPRLATSEIGASAIQSRNSELQALLLQTSDKTPVPARRDRLLTLHTVITFLPTTDLHFIPSVLSEVVLACKDTNQRAREAGFNLLIQCTNRIIDPERNPAGTVIRNYMVPHMPDDAPDALATLEEAFTMVSAGLAGVATHMVAATVAALARMLYDFHTQLARATCEDLVGTVELFLQSRNREIVRAVLGFIKVCVVVLPDDMLKEDRMVTMLSGCMVWSDENKGRMRMKVKGILERCIRRFGAEKIERWMGENEGGRKLVTNLRKRKERAKRKKNKDDDDAEDLSDEQGSQHAKQKRPGFDNEFDEAVYGSGDEDDDSDIILASDIDGGDDRDGINAGVSLKKGASTARTKAFSARKPAKGSTDQIILTNDDPNADEDDPLDLLGPTALASISSSRKARAQHASGAAKMLRMKAKSNTAVNADGKLVFNGDSAAKSKDQHASQDVVMGGADGRDGADGAARDTAVNAYMDALKGPDAVRRGQKGKLKISSSNKRQRDGERNPVFGKSVHDGEMDLDHDEASHVGRKGNIGGDEKENDTSQSRFGQTRRRGLGVDKNQNQRQKVHGNRAGARVQKHRSFSASGGGGGGGGRPVGAGAAARHGNGRGRGTARGTARGRGRSR